MNYGYFDDTRREYVITRPDTPTSWSNYAGDRKFGAIVTNNAGGYGFSLSPAQGRFLRLIFNSVPMDQPGRYFYLRDRDSGDFWSASWQPVGKPLDQYQSTCRFGMGYSIIESRYADIETTYTYFVPVGQAFEYWRLKVRNTGSRPRKLSLFTYAEFAGEWGIFQDAFNLQYTQYTVKSEWREGMARIGVLDNLPADEGNFSNRDQGRWTFLMLTGQPVVGYDLEREKFVGPYRSYHNPLVVAQGRCSNSSAYGGNACGCLQADVDLAPGEEKEVLVLLGVGKAETVGVETRARWGNPAACDRAFADLQAYWQGRMGAILAQTPDKEFNSMLNVWGAYNALMTFTWSRSCSLVYTGDSRDGYGFRDTVQDIVGIALAIPGEAKERLRLMLSGQESTGGARPEIRAWEHKPGQMPLTDPEEYRSDDCLWFFNAIPTYVAESGDVAFYREVVPYSDQGQVTVLGHLRRALEFNLERRGAHNLPCGLVADWNDCLKLGFHGESIFVTFQLRFGLKVYADVAASLGEAAEAAWARQQLQEVDAFIQKHTWDGEWFLRAFREDGTTLGSHRKEEGKIFLEPQPWAVISGAATPAQAEACMNAVEKHLETPYGIVICDPGFRRESVTVVRAILMNPGLKENAGIFSHTQGWAIMADCMLGHGDRAWRHLAAFLPSKYNDRADLREIEPYVHCQSTDGKESPRAGRSHVPWLSGTAAWTFYTMAYYVLGLRPEVDGFTVDPCIPSDWPGFTATRRFRGMNLHVEVQNPQRKCKGVTRLTVDGAVVPGSTIPLAKLRDGSRIVAVL